MSALFLNGWFFKATAFVLCVTLAPLDVAATIAAGILGLIAGHALDVWLGRTASSAYLRFTFTALGYVAKSHGHIRREHITYAESLMARLLFDEHQRHVAIGWFADGKSGARKLDYIALLCKYAPSRPTLEHIILRCLYECAYLFGTPSRQVLDALQKVLAAIDLPPDACDRFKQIDEGGQDAAITDARHCLGLPDDADVDAIKLAYRRLVKRYHPDTQPNASPAELARCERLMSEFRDAYELLLTHVDLADTS